MNLIHHEDRRPDVKEVHLQFDPLTIWVDPQTQLVIERGDLLGQVAEAIKKYFPLSRNERRDLVGYWFALGERLRSKKMGPWTRRELQPASSRRYLKGLKRGSPRPPSLLPQ